MGASTERLEFDANASKVLAEYAKVIAESKKLTSELQKGAREAVKGSTEASAGLAAQAKAVVDVANKQHALKKSISDIEQQRRSSAAAEIAAIKNVKAEEDLLLSVMGLHGKAAVKAGLDAERAFSAEAVAAAKLRQERMAGVSAFAAEAAAEKAARSQSVSAAIAQLKRLEAQERLLQKEVNQTTTAFVQSGALSSKALDSQVAHLAGVQKQMAGLRTVINGAGAQFGQFGRSAGQANNNLTQLSFAADDFMTVLQMNNYSMHGWIAGLRSAGNNLSFVLASINPLYAIIPSVGTALAGFLIPRLFGSADASKAAADSGKEYTRILVEMREALIGVSQGEKAAQSAKEERVHSEQLAKITEETGFREKEAAFRQAEAVLIDAQTSKNLTPKGRELAVKQAMKQFEPAQQEFQAAKNTIQKFVDDRRKVVAGREAKQLEEQQQANFKRTNAAAVRGAEGKYGTFSGEIKKRAELGFAQGLSEQEVIANLSPVMAAGLNEGEQEAAAPKFFEDIAAAQQDAALRPIKGADQVAATGLKRKLLEIRAARAQAVADSPRQKLSATQERAFREQEAQPQADLAALEAKIAASTEIQKDMRDGIKDLVKIVAGRNAGRPVDRNGGQ